VSWLSEELVRRGHDVTLFASGDSITNANLVPACPRALRLDPDCKDPLAHHVLLLERVFGDAANFDLIHSHVDYLPFPLARRTRTPMLTTLHGRLDLPHLVPIYRTFREQAVVSISDAQRSFLPWANWKGTVHHGMPAASLRVGDGSGKYLAFLGRVSPEKGLPDAIEIALRAGMSLKIAAKVDAEDRAYHEEQIKPLLNSPNIEFIGEIGNDEKGAFLGDAAALLFPINWAEPFGLVMIEAMACGTPVIAYRKGSVPEVIQDGVSGFVVQDTDSAVAAVRRLHQIDRKACRAHFDKYFTDERMVRDYLDIYRNMVRREPTALTVNDGVLNWTDLAPNTTT
jgi:glycosyltransferase involved in cell wall biosynthesis